MFDAAGSGGDPTRLKRYCQGKNSLSRESTSIIEIIVQNSGSFSGKR